MTEIKDGGPAFPAEANCPRHPGMTLRAYIATAAMSGILANQKLNDEMEEMSESEGSEYTQAVADQAAEYADALLKALEVNPTA